MITFRYYDKENKIDKVWYDSSTIIYSECEDKENDYKTLKVVFKGGSTYVYYEVDVQDYVMFIAGGLDGSNGKALNKYIKPKCDFERLPSTNLEDLELQLQQYKEIKEKEI